MGVLAAMAVTLAFVPISEAKKCKKTERNCGGECIAKDAPCKKVKTLGGKTDKKVEDAPDKETATGKSIEDKLADDKGNKGKVDKGKVDKGKVDKGKTIKGIGDKGESSEPDKGESMGPRGASTATIKGCKSHADLATLDKGATGQLIRAAGWTASEPKSKETDDYKIWVYDMKKGGDSAVVGVYAYTRSAHATRLEANLNQHKNVATAISADQTHVIAAILPKSGNKAQAKALLEAIVACQK